MTEAGRHELVSPEGVRLELPLAGPAPRMFAYMIDGALVVLLAFALGLLLFALLPLAGIVSEWLGQLDLERLEEGRVATGMLLGFLVFWLLAQFVIETGYFIFWEMVTNGRSPGKAALGLRVVGLGGEPIDLRASLVRNLLRAVDILPGNYVIGLISILVSPRHQRLGDYAAGTLVIRLDRPERAVDIAIEPGLPALAVSRERLAAVGAEELRLLRATLRRVGSLEPERRERLLLEVAESFRLLLGLEELAGDDPHRFLQQVYVAAQRLRK